MSYNGWSNYETWAVALWMDNDQGSYYYARELARDAMQDNGGTALFAGERRTASGVVADALKDWHSEMMPDLDASVWSDLLGAAFSEVDWYEIADHLVSELEEEESEES